MPVYNGARFLPEAVESILGQSFRDLEFLAIDDGSTDDTPQILHDYALRDSRIRVLHNARKLGISQSLNRALSEAKCEFVARQDADDVSASTRLERQIAHMRSHPDCVLLGTWYSSIDESGEHLASFRPPTSCQALRQRLLRGNCFAHGSVMLRMATRPRYDGSFERAQDYELWTRLALEGDISNCSEFLYCLRQHSGRVTLRFSRTQALNAPRIASSYVRHLVQSGRLDIVVDAYIQGIGCPEVRQRMRRSLLRSRSRQSPASLYGFRLGLGRSIRELPVFLRHFGFGTVGKWLVCNKLRRSIQTRFLSMGNEAVKGRAGA